MGELELLVVVNLAGCAESFGMMRTWRVITPRSTKERRPPATHNWVHAKGLINDRHAIVELWYVFIGLYRVRTARKQMLHLLEFGHQVLHP